MDSLLLHGLPVMGILFLALNKNTSFLPRSLRLMAPLALVTFLGYKYLTPAALRGSFRQHGTRVPTPARPLATYGSTQYFSPVSMVADANYTCFASGGTGAALSCAAWFCNTSTEVTAAVSTQSCVTSNPTTYDYVAKVKAIAPATCTQSSDYRCSSANLTAVFSRFPTVLAAYCTDKYLVVITTGLSRTQTYNLDNIPYPPGGTASDGSACRTRSGSMTQAWSKQSIPLTPVPLSSAALTNNMNNATWPGGAGYHSNGWMKDGNNLEFGIPTSSGVGFTVTGQELYPVFNNVGGFTPEKCEVDACNSHVGQGVCVCVCVCVCAFVPQL